MGNKIYKFIFYLLNFASFESIGKLMLINNRDCAPLSLWNTK